MIALLGVAFATPSFDPTTPEVRFEGAETWTQDETVRLWNAVERWRDPDASLFVAESFNEGITWRDTDYTPWIASAFDTGTPHSSAFLLHVGVSEPVASGTPILLVPGAGDNGSRGFVTLATRLDRTRRPVFALTFAHPHGDVFRHAEAIADAIAVITSRTGAAQVDLVAHSKGGIAATVYTSNEAGADWGRDDYEAAGTPYRGDVRRMVLIATPLDGVDTSFRWTGPNLYALDADAAISPTSWDRYYPSGALFPLIFDDLIDQDFDPDGLDLFPGQRQLLSRQAPPLPGSSAWLGAYALQPDWLTTYEGGTGFVSRSDGIDAAIDAGGDLIDRLTTRGVDPSIALYLLAGTNPLLPNADAELTAQFDLLGDAIDYEALATDLTDHGTPVTLVPDEVAALEDGLLLLGEVTGRSDGLIFLSSALAKQALDARGAVVLEERSVDLSHLDLLYASPITGQLLIDAADAGGPNERWMRPVGERYITADTLGWIESVLADSATTPPGASDPTDPTEATGIDETFARPCGSCATPVHEPTFPWLLGLALAAATRRRGPQVGAQPGRAIG